MNKFMNWSDKNVLVTGSSGFFGSKVVELLKQKKPNNIITTDSKKNDLRQKSNCEQITKDVDIVFHIAANVGGIGLNKEKPGELFYDNLLMGTYLMDESRKNKVEKFISLGTMCSYPKITSMPIKEVELWNGYPEEVTAAYGLSKKMQIVQSIAYKQQYDFNSITVFVTNLFGPNDNFDNESSHVIPSIIKKILTAKNSNQSFVELWGDGTPTRDFLFIDDACRGLILAAEKYDDVEPLNLGSGIEISIEEVSKLIMQILNIDLEIRWNTDMPNGQPRRCVDITKAKKVLGFEPSFSLKIGLEKTIQWYKNNYY